MTLVALRRIDTMPVLLAIDIGVKTGLALYGHDLVGGTSSHFPA